MSHFIRAGKTTREFPMRAMVFDGKAPHLRLQQIAIPDPGPEEVLLKVEACGVCRTDLHIIDRELGKPKLPLIPGHEIVGRVEGVGSNVAGIKAGQRVGVPWLGRTCGACRFCQSQKENLCDAPGFTGYTLNGGYAEYCKADARYVFLLPEHRSAETLAPLLCAGLIGYRTFRLCGSVRKLGIYGFGAAAHILCQIACFLDIEVFAFTRDGDTEAQAFALEMGAVWAGDSSLPPPETLDAAAIFAPVGALVPRALKHVAKGGRVVCGGIHMSDIPSFPYADLWEERSILSVANLTRRDGEEFFPLVEKAGVTTQTVPYPLEQANSALDDLRSGRLQGAAVLVP